MDKTEIRAVIKYFCLKGKSATEIKTEMDSVLGDSAPSKSTVCSWVSEFKRGRTSTIDEPRSGRPKTASSDKMIEKIHRMILNDRRSKVRELADATNISTERVYHILTDELGMRKLSARWVPRLLTPEQKIVRVVHSEECLDIFERDPKEFLRRYVTVDETWVHYYTPETKEQSKQWIARGEPAPKKAKTVKSADKVMATVF